jgi:predicted phosphate transport protein (TIGR00153 family)
MKETRNILAWIGAAEGKAVLDDARAHVEETCNTVRLFSEEVKAFISGDASGRAAALEGIAHSEHLADTLKAKMVRKLSDSLLLPPDRQDLLTLVKTLDKIADRTLSTGRLLNFIEARLPDGVLANISASTDLIVRSVARLKDGIDCLIRNDAKGAIENCEEADRIEHEADDQKRILIDAIIHASLDQTSLLLGYHLAEYLEGITDRIEDAAHLVKGFALKAR